MKFQIEVGGPLLVSEVDGVHLEVLRQIPRIARSEDPSVRARIFASPGGDAELERDWREYVQPELEERFQQALDGIESDLAAFKRGKKGGQFHILRENWENWLTGLNQARLALWAEHRFTDLEMSDQQEIVESRRATAFFAMNLYGFFQEILLRILQELEKEPENPV